MKRRNICAALACVFLCGVLTACGNGDVPSVPEESSKPQSAVGAASKPSAGGASPTVPADSIDWIYVEKTPLAPVFRYGNDELTTQQFTCPEDPAQIIIANPNLEGDFQPDAIVRVFFREGDRSLEGDVEKMFETGELAEDIEMVEMGDFKNHIIYFERDQQCAVVRAITVYFGAQEDAIKMFGKSTEKILKVYPTVPGGPAGGDPDNTGPANGTDSSSPTGGMVVPHNHNFPVDYSKVSWGKAEHALLYGHKTDEYPVLITESDSYVSHCTYPGCDEEMNYSFSLREDIEEEGFAGTGEMGVWDKGVNVTHMFYLITTFEDGTSNSRYKYSINYGHITGCAKPDADEDEIRYCLNKCSCRQNNGYERPTDED